MKKKLFSIIELDTMTNVEEEAVFFANNGADVLLLGDFYTCDAEHDRNISYIKEIAKVVDVSLYVFGGIRRLEDVKKYLYAGADKAVLNMDRESNRNLLEEASKRFGKEKIAVYVSDADIVSEYQTLIETYASELILHADQVKEFFEITKGLTIPVVAGLSGNDSVECYMKLLQGYNVSGCTGALFNERTFNFQAFKLACKAMDISMCITEAVYKWADFKLNSDGMIPVIVQDHKTDQVLMLAYMNEEAYNLTVSTGKMTYWSRSRNEIWIKGDTSGHYQYVKSLTLDCDKDTILAKVHQIGAACHTGSYSCFFNKNIDKESNNSYNPHKVLEDVYQVISDRKANPKEGSYTNYLFDKGIDKILKKIGEEATEIVIAAKNPDPEEIKYEVSDFLYHVMVLMVERGVTWEDITRELANR